MAPTSQPPVPVPSAPPARPPRVTFYVQAYNQERFVAAAVAAALAQDYDDMEFVFCDDGSQDRTWDILQATVPARHCGRPCRLVRNDPNQGIGASVNRVMAMARGEIVVIAAGDDLSYPQRTASLVGAFDAAPASEKIYSAWSAADYIDDAGQALARTFPGHNAFTDRDMAFSRHGVIGATHAWRREVFEAFGPLDPAVMFEDATISFRSHLLGRIAWVPEALVAYRVHDQNLTNFNATQDHRALYAGSARRAKWAMATYRQKLADLEHWQRHLRGQRQVPSRDAAMLRRGTLWLARANRRRMLAYEQFPTLSSALVMHAMFDREVMKVFLRSLSRRRHA